MSSRDSDVSQVRLSFALAACLLGCLVIGQLGCSKGSTNNESNPVEPPAAFSDAQGKWVLSNGELVAQDEQLIDRFFHQHPELVGSPEWIGTPMKYALEGSPSSQRFYWFHGSVANAYWNALEVGGSGFRDFNGTGLPGAGQ